MKKMLVLVFFATLFLGLWYWRSTSSKENNEKTPIMAEYPGKIVYGTSGSLDVEALRRDCQRRKGEFNACGNKCAPDSPGCDEVCAYTCEFPF